MEPKPKLMSPIIKIPKAFIWATICISILPLLLNMIGVEFGSTIRPFDLELAKQLSSTDLLDLMYANLSGSFTHTLLEWSAISIAFVTVVLAFAHFQIKQDAVTPIIGIALFTAGFMDAFHTLAADRLISATADNENLVPPDIVGESNWLPAIELFGEGVFFTLDEKILKQWEKIDSVKKRTDEIAKRYENSDLNLQKDIVISPRFLLLHTLSHLLIRELETTAGYPAASLKERIYCSQDSKMAGVLIYTVVADIVGSLGGIIESGEPKKFLELMSNVFKHAQWCSLDPVCTEHQGQGPSWLNRAACHACALIPEPSCEFGNVFLDRVFIKGNESLGIPAFLDFVMEINNG